MKIRRIACILECCRWEPDENGRNLNKWPDSFKEAVKSFEFNIVDFSIHIPTLEGTMKCMPGDYIIRGIKGEFYPIKPDIFEEIYEEVPSKKKASMKDTEIAAMCMSFYKSAKQWNWKSSFESHQKFCSSPNWFPFLSDKIDSICSPDAREILEQLYAMEVGLTE